MDLLKAVQTESLDTIKQLAVSKPIPVNSKWLDYAILNTALSSRRKDVAKFLLERGCRVNKTDKPAAAVAHDTPLHHAVLMDDVDLVTDLLVRKASVAMPNEDCDTPLHLAFMRRNDKIVDTILPFVRCAKEVNSRNRHGLTHMHIACIRNNVAVVQKFIKAGVNVEIAVNEDSPLWPGYTPLHFAADFRCIDVIKVLMAAHADAFSRDAENLTPIHRARSNFQEASVVDYLMFGDNKENSYGILTVLSNFHVACMKNDSGLVESFIDNGAAVNNPICHNSVFCPLYTPLHFAVESNCKENVELLLEHGARVEYQNKYYMTPLHLALYNENHDDKETIVDLLYSALDAKERDCTDLNGLSYFHVAITRNNVQIVKRFLDRGEDVNGQILYNVKNFAHYTPLHFAARYRCKETAELLISQGANVNRSDLGMHGTPLHVAFENGDTDMVELLLKNGARANAIRPFDDKTMLHIFINEMMERSTNHDDIRVMLKLISKQDSDIVYIRKLISLGCDVNAQDVDGNTALHLACSKLRDGITMVKILLECGADINLENNEGRTPFYESFNDIYRMNAESYMVLYHHVQKLKALGMRVNPKNEQCCEKLLNEKEECNPEATCFTEKHMAQKQQQRLAEIVEMKRTKVDKKSTLYQVLFEDSRKLAQRVKDDDGLKRIVQEEGFKKKFPVYGYMLRLQYQKGIGNAGDEVFEKPAKAVDAPPAVMRETRSKRQRVK